MILFALITILLSILGYLFYRYGTKNEDYFSRLGLPYMKPQFLMGNSAAFFDSKVTLGSYIQKAYKSYPTSKAFGMFDFRKPVLMLRDPALIKQFCVKHADNFADHRPFLDETMDVLFGNSMFAMRGEKWREMRSTLSPAFTGSKMRLMFELLEQVCEQMMKNLRETAREKGGVVDYEMKELCSRFTTDVIAICAFGIKVDSLAEPKNDFFEAGEVINDFGRPETVRKMMGFQFAPWFMRFFNIQIFGGCHKFFKDMVLGTMRVREEKNIHRPDMINMLMQIRKGKLEAEKHGGDKLKQEEEDSIGFATAKDHVDEKTKARSNWNDDELVAQCFLFFIAGYDTSSTGMSFAAYHLAVNQEIQARLYAEIVETRNQNSGALTYETLQKMKYLDQVVTETLRLNPPSMMSDRVCVKDCVVEDAEKTFRMECKKGLGLFIPFYCIQQDPEYYPNPEKFDPERFSEENKSSINPDTYLVFGVGPRNCIGSRFALMQIKALVYHLLLNFSLEVVKKTDIPLTYKKNLGRDVPVNGLWIGLKPRE